MMDGITNRQVILHYHGDFNTIGIKANSISTIPVDRFHSSTSEHEMISEVSQPMNGYSYVSRTSISGFQPAEDSPVLRDILSVTASASRNEDDPPMHYVESKKMMMKNDNRDMSYLQYPSTVEHPQSAVNAPLPEHDNSLEELLGVDLGKEIRRKVKEEVLHSDNQFPHTKTPRAWSVEHDRWCRWLQLLTDEEREKIRRYTDQRDLEELLATQQGVKVKAGFLKERVVEKTVRWLLLSDKWKTVETKALMKRSYAGEEISDAEKLIAKVLGENAPIYIRNREDKRTRKKKLVKEDKEQCQTGSYHHWSSWLLSLRMDQMGKVQLYVQDWMENEKMNGNIDKENGNTLEMIEEGKETMEDAIRILHTLFITNEWINGRGTTVGARKKWKSYWLAVKILKLAAGENCDEPSTQRGKTKKALIRMKRWLCTLKVDHLDLLRQYVFRNGTSNLAAAPSEPKKRGRASYNELEKIICDLLTIGDWQEYRSEVTGEDSRYKSAMDIMQRARIWRRANQMMQKVEMKMKRVDSQKIEKNCIGSLQEGSMDQFDELGSMSKRLLYDPTVVNNESSIGMRIHEKKMEDETRNDENDIMNDGSTGDNECGMHTDVVEKTTLYPNTSQRIHYPEFSTEVVIEGQKEHEETQKLHNVVSDEILTIGDTVDISDDDNDLPMDGGNEVQEAEGTVNTAEDVIILEDTSEDESVVMEEDDDVILCSDSESNDIEYVQSVFPRKECSISVTEAYKEIERLEFELFDRWMKEENEKENTEKKREEGMSITHKVDSELLEDRRRDENSIGMMEMECNTCSSSEGESDETQMKRKQDHLLWGVWLCSLSDEELDKLKEMVKRAQSVGVHSSTIDRSLLRPYRLNGIDTLFDLIDTQDFIQYRELARNDFEKICDGFNEGTRLLEVIHVGMTED